jgi:hypothetical protein
MRAGAAWAVVALLITAGASPAPRLPVPPIPPAHPPTDQLAPLPNPDVTGPFEAAPGGPQVGLSNFTVNRYDRSLGYSPGSHFQTSEDKRPIQTPGLTIRVPLQ